MPARLEKALTCSCRTGIFVLPIYIRDFSHKFSPAISADRIFFEHDTTLQCSRDAMCKDVTGVNLQSSCGGSSKFDIFIGKSFRSRPAVGESAKLFREVLTRASIRCSTAAHAACWWHMHLRLRRVTLGLHSKTWASPKKIISSARYYKCFGFSNKSDPSISLRTIDQSADDKLPWFRRVKVHMV